MNKPDCFHKDNYTNPKSYTNHRRWCLGHMSSYLEKRKVMIKELSPRWKGNDSTYSSKHEWLRKWLKKPNTCNACNKRAPKEVANLDGRYNRDDLFTWMWMCVPCHRRLDGQTDKFIEWRKRNNPSPYWKGKKRSEEFKKNLSNKMKIKVKTRMRDERGLFI